jgi:hypothetical protein
MRVDGGRQLSGWPDILARHQPVLCCVDPLAVLIPLAVWHHRKVS